jgi:hypothetical protein
MHISLIHLIPSSLRGEIDKQFSFIVQYHSELRFTLWPRLNKGIRFLLKEHPHKELILQACYQYLAHHHCIISAVICGYSFSSIHSNSSPIISNSASYWYLTSGMSQIKHNQSIGEIDWLLSTNMELWKDICGVYLIYEYRYQESKNDVVKFAEKFAPMNKVNTYRETHHA